MIDILLSIVIAIGVLLISWYILTRDPDLEEIDETGPTSWLDEPDWRWPGEGR